MDTNKQNEKVDSFQRLFIRTFVLNISWSTIAKNEDIFAKMKLEPWSIIIIKTCLRWFGKIALIDPSATACSALYHVLEEFWRSTGKPLKQQLKNEL